MARFLSEELKNHSQNKFLNNFVIFLQEYVPFNLNFEDK